MTDSSLASAVDPYQGDFLLWRHLRGDTHVVSIPHQSQSSQHMMKVQSV